ncbi:DUF7222 domain-containing protein [Bacillus paralicheniformis]|uniref:DUF7222 domain-containing protein n=1 Tax=Bacillus paralicheniformis TaxID=1648923 RepID=UPI00189D03D7|nr:hypothetical protein [Bacillus paralicheniformis]
MTNNTVREWLENWLDDSDDKKTTLEDISSHGCQSGVVPELIYYSDTHKFFDVHYNSIMELVEEYREMTGSEVQFNGDLKNYYSWFAVEFMAWELLNELEMVE